MTSPLSLKRTVGQGVGELEASRIPFACNSLSVCQKKWLPDAGEICSKMRSAHIRTLQDKVGQRSEKEGAIPVVEVSQGGMKRHTKEGFEMREVSNSHDRGEYEISMKTVYPLLWWVITRYHFPKFSTHESNPHNPNDPTF